MKSFSLRRGWSNLPTQILLGLIGGIVVGAVLGERSVMFEVIGKIFIRLLLLVILPLVIASIFVAVISVSDLRRLGRMAGLALGCIVLMTALASVVGVGSAVALKPGHALGASSKARILLDYQTQTQRQLKSFETKPTVSSLVLNLIPSNPFQAAAEGNLLQVIFFSGFLAWGAAKIAPERQQTLRNFFEGISGATGEMIRLLLKTAPIGVFALMASAVGRFGIGLLLSLATYIVTVVGTMIVFFFVFHFTVVRFLAQRSFLDFWKAIRDAQFVAAATTSSMVTLPISLQCAEDNLKVPTPLTRFVLPLAATISHDGGGIYQGVSAVFVAQLYGLSLSPYELALIVIVATLAGLATASIPSGGFINLAITLAVIGVPLDGLAFLLGIDRLIDMFRTALNVSGQLAATVFVEAKTGIQSV